MHLRHWIPLVLALASFPCSADTAAAPRCSAEAVEQARKLLAFHFDDDGNLSVEEQARELPSLRNPANPKQKLAVLEVWGFIYKGEYRMRLIYHRTEQRCVLVGQEILEHAKL